jgi:Protein of unknown function (DUF3102)
MTKTTHSKGDAEPDNIATLAQISAKIKALEKAHEKKSIQNVVAIGKLLHEAEDQCDHGEYMKWVKSEFEEWSHQTALNYRDVYELSQNPNILEFDKLNIALSALYRISYYFLDQNDSDDQDDQEQLAIGMAVVEAARHRRISFKEACKICEEMEGRLYDEKQPKPKPEPDDEEDEEPAPKPKPKPPVPDDLDDEDDTPPDGVGLSQASLTIGGCTRSLEYAIGVLQIKNVEIDEEIFQEFADTLAELNRQLDKYKAPRPPEPTTRAKQKKQKESVH